MLENTDLGSRGIILSMEQKQKHWSATQLLMKLIIWGNIPIWRWLLVGPKTLTPSPSHVLPDWKPGPGVIKPFYAQLYSLCSKNKGAHQLRGYLEADLRLCFPICKTLFSHNAAHFMLSSVKHEKPFITLGHGRQVLWTGLILFTHNFFICQGEDMEQFTVLYKGLQATHRVYVALQVNLTSKNSKLIDIKANISHINLSYILYKQQSRRSGCTYSLIVKSLPLFVT